MKRIQPATHAADVLKEGDVVLAADGAVVSSFRDLEVAALHTPAVDLTVLRDGEVTTLRCETDAIVGTGTSRFITWCGALVQVHS